MKHFQRFQKNYAHVTRLGAGSDIYYGMNGDDNVNGGTDVYIVGKGKDVVPSDEMWRGIVEALKA